mgnify:CR=1 FL=1
MKKRNTGKKIAKYVVIAIILFVLLFPVYWMINCSLLPSNVIMSVPDQRDAEELLADLYPRVLSAVFPEQLHRLLRNDRDRAAGCGSRELRAVPL